jgi:hypothetical protein
MTIENLLENEQTLEEQVATAYGVKIETIKQRWLPWFDKVAAGAGLDSRDDIDDQTYSAMLHSYGAMARESSSFSKRRQWCADWVKKLKIAQPQAVESVDAELVEDETVDGLIQDFSTALAVRNQESEIALDELRDRFYLQSPLASIPDAINSVIQNHADALRSQVKRETFSRLAQAVTAGQRDAQVALLETLRLQAEEAFQ